MKHQRVSTVASITGSYNGQQNANKKVVVSHSPMSPLTRNMSQSKISADLAHFYEPESPDPASIKHASGLVRFANIQVSSRDINNINNS